MDFSDLRLIANTDDLKEWNTLWELEGDYVKCKVCSFAQRPQEANYPFTHRETCTAAGAYPHFPWRDLTWIIEQMKRDLE
jgi:hypothetical protein